MNKFVVIVPGSTTDQATAVARHFTPARAAWWHYSADVWLLSFMNEHPTPAALRDEINSLIPGTEFLVVTAADGPEWAGWALTVNKETWETWFGQYWI